MKKQKLDKRTVKPNTPTGASQARSNCGLSLNKEETLSVAGSKTSSNNPEVNQHQRTGECKIVVYVISVEGKPLMPCKPAKARKLLASGKAKVVRRFPFTIQLNFECENQIQEINFGIDSGYKEVGFSATTEKKEVASGVVKLDDKTSSRLTEKRMYRRGRRSRHHWYRKPRFLNRKIKKGWLPPSTQRKYDTHLKVLNLYKKLLPVTKVIIETANFDIQKINNPDISGVEYQQGDLYEYQNMRAYLMAREGGKCQLCKDPFKKGTPSHIHHCLERGKQGSNMAKNLAILHKKCHDKLHKKGLKLPAPKTMKAETFMSIIQSRFKKDIPNVEITFGYKTFVDRNNLKLEKTHFNDAFVISGGTTQERISPTMITQKRRNNRAIQLNRKGFKPSIRKQRYKIQPHDLVWIGENMYHSTSVHCNGERVIIKEINKSILIKKINKVYNFGSLILI